MTLASIVPDVPTAPLDPVRTEPLPETATSPFARVLDDVGSSLQRAQHAEDAFAHHSGSLFDAMYERAQADVALSVAAATAQRVTSSVQSLLNMQV